MKRRSRPNSNISSEWRFLQNLVGADVNEELEQVRASKSPAAILRLLKKYQEWVLDSVVKNENEHETEFQVLASDRAALVEAAVDFSMGMLARHYYEMQATVPSKPKFLKGEIETYRSALSFLKRQWDDGASKTEIVQTRCRTREAKG